ncbi:MAG: ABC transporter permease [Bdellovibrionales bacterium]|nr:ABC transporter permease [Bdellovibrionales bacterium]
MRDLKHMRAQVITISIVVACGIATLVGFLSTYESLKYAQQQFYDQSRFADAFASLKRAPTHIIHLLNNIDGVTEVEDRLVFELLIDLETRDEPAVGRFVSIPDIGPSHLNRLSLQKGRWPAPGRHDEVLVGEAFFKTNNLELDQTISAVFNGRYRRLRVVGSVVSPEYIYAVQGANPMPDDKHFGVFWIPRSALAASFDMEGAFNSLSFALGPNISVKSVLQAIDRILKPYGGFGSIARKDQTSHMFITQEIYGLQVQATFVPFIFLSVAAFLLNVVISRIVATQREQVATLKALGFFDSSIAWHFLKLSVVISLLGGALGLLFGYWIGYSMTDLYTMYFRMPLLAFIMPQWLPFTGIGLSLFASIVGVAHALRGIFKLTPAEAMRPPSPPSYHGSLVERSGFTKKFSTEGRMVIRGLTLKPLRSVLTSVGMSFACLIIVLGFFWQDSIDHLLQVQFSLMMRQNVDVTFTGPVSTMALEELKRHEGVIDAEGYRSVGVKLHAEHRSEPAGLVGMPSPFHLRQILNEKLEPLSVPEEGLLLSRSLANKLKVKSGDFLRVEVLEGARPERLLPVVNIADEFVGGAGYMNLRAINQFLKESNLITSAGLTIDNRFAPKLYAELKQMPKIAGVSFKDTTLKTFNETSAKYLIVFSLFLLGFAMVIAFGIVYNSARISFSERSWELASLRVLGFTKLETFRILVGEIVILILCSIPLGWYLGVQTTKALINEMAPEAMQIPFVIQPSTFTYSALVMVASGVLSGFVIWRKVRNLDMIEALKVRG